MSIPKNLQAVVTDALHTLSPQSVVLTPTQGGVIKITVVSSKFHNMHPIKRYQAIHNLLSKNLPKYYGEIPLTFHALSVKEFRVEGSLSA